jgi:hypothetical protein
MNGQTMIAHELTNATIPEGEYCNPLDEPIAPTRFQKLSTSALAMPSFRNFSMKGKNRAAADMATIADAVDAGIVLYIIFISVKPTPLRTEINNVHNLARQMPFK